MECLGELGDVGYLTRAPGQQADVLDVAAAAEAIEVNLEALASKGQIGQEIAAAWRRIEDGTYGLCIKCGEQIPPARLEAIPYAGTCVPCQQEIDNTLSARKAPHLHLCNSSGGR